MIKPLLNKVLIKIIKKDNTSKGGIILSEGTKDKIQYGLVIEVGPGTKENKMQVEKGQKIIIEEYSGVEVNYNNEEYLIIEQKDILAIIDN